MKERWHPYEIRAILNQQSENDETGETSGRHTACAEEPGSTLMNHPTRESFAVAEWNGHKHQPIPEANSTYILNQTP